MLLEYEIIVLALKGSVPAREPLDPASYAQASGVEDRAAILVFLLCFVASQVLMTFERKRRGSFVGLSIFPVCE